MIRVNNELHREFEPLENGLESLSKEEQKLLQETEDYYRNSQDNFNLFRLKLKIGNIQEAEKIANIFLQQKEAPNIFSHYANNPAEMEKANLLEFQQAYVISYVALAKNDENLQRKAREKFLSYAEKQSQQKTLSGYEASALGFWQARRLTPRGKERDQLSQKCIEQFRKVVENRARAGDRWWESIALRQIAKISKDPNDKKIALQRAEELIQEYIQMGDYKKAALWARDVNDLDPSDKHTKRMKTLWQKNIKEVQKSGKMRDVGKSHWELYKRLKRQNPKEAEGRRLLAIKEYKRLLAEAKASGNEAEIRECYWVLSELIK